ncbi:MAG: amidohydrolase [Sphingomicrobium sp.]
MYKLPIAIAAALLGTAAQSTTLFDHANGVQADARGRIERFDGILISDDGKVVRILRKGEARPAAKRVVDVGGKTMLPGLIDAHGHIMGLGFAALTLDLTGTTSLADLQQRLKDYAAAHPDYPWIVGRGWNQESWSDKCFPTADDLNSVVPGRPVWLERVDGHAAVANTAAMKLANVGPGTKAPAGGEIHDGLFVDNAMDMVGKVIPEPTAEMRDRALAEAQSAMLKVGLVGAADMGSSADDWAAFRRAGEASTLKVRLFSYASAPENWRAINGSKPTGWMYGGRLRLLGTKLYADGALGSRGAWLKAPYHDRPDTRGLQFHSDGELLAQAREVAGGGGQIATHAIGDAANAQVISIYEKLTAEFGSDRRWRIEHLQIADPKDFPRLKPAGIIASMQPTHQTSDRLMAEARLGRDRLVGAYAWNTMLKRGVPLAFGSDFPVESPNPFPGLSAAISRQDGNGQPAGGWLPGERITLGQALHAFTRGAAFAGFSEAEMGALDPGKWADFIIVDRDPTTVDAQALARTKVLETWVAGERVWAAQPNVPSGEPEK